MKALFSFFDQYHKVSEASRIALEGILSEKQYAKNDILQNIGHTCKTIYFLKSGIARIYYYHDGMDITESFSFENNIIARVESLFTGKPSSKAIQILEDATIIAIDATALFKLYDAHHDIERLFRIIFEHGYVETVQRIENIQFHTAEERYLALLRETNYIEKIPLKYIASYLGITQVSLSRIRGQVK